MTSDFNFDIAFGFSPPRHANIIPLKNKFHVNRPSIKYQRSNSSHAMTPSAQPNHSDLHELLRDLTTTFWETCFAVFNFTAQPKFHLILHASTAS